MGRSSGEGALLLQGALGEGGGGGGQLDKGRGKQKWIRVDPNQNYSLVFFFLPKMYMHTAE